MHHCPRCTLAEDLVERSDGTPEMEALINVAVRSVIAPGSMMHHHDIWRWWVKALKLYQETPSVGTYYLIVMRFLNLPGPSPN